MKRQCPICGWHPSSVTAHVEAARAHAVEVGGFKARRHHRQVAKRAANADTWKRLLRRG